MYYYEIHVENVKNGYSVGVQCEESLNEEEVVELALQQQKFEKDGDHYCIDSVETITEEKFNKWFKH